MVGNNQSGEYQMESYKFNILKDNKFDYGLIGTTGIGYETPLGFQFDFRYTWAWATYTITNMRECPAVRLLAFKTCRSLLLESFEKKKTR